MTTKFFWMDSQPLFFFFSSGALLELALRGHGASLKGNSKELK